MAPHRLRTEPEPTLTYPPHPVRKRLPTIKLVAVVAVLWMALATYGCAASRTPSRVGTAQEYMAYRAVPSDPFIYRPYYYPFWFGSPYYYPYPYPFGYRGHVHKPRHHKPHRMRNPASKAKPSQVHPAPSARPGQPGRTQHRGRHGVHAPGPRP